MPIDRVDSQPIQFPRELGPLVSRPPSSPEAGERFGDLLVDALGEVNELQNVSAQRIEAFVRGEDVPLHEVVLAQEEAEISFRLLLEVRDKLVQAYQDILRTPM